MTFVKVVTYMNEVKLSVNGQKTTNLKKKTIVYLRFLCVILFL